MIPSTCAGAGAFDVLMTSVTSLSPHATLIVWGDQDRVPVASTEVQEMLVEQFRDADLVAHADAATVCIGSNQTASLQTMPPCAAGGCVIHKQGY